MSDGQLQIVNQKLFHIRRKDFIINKISDRSINSRLWNYFIWQMEDEKVTFTNMHIVHTSRSYSLEAGRHGNWSNTLTRRREIGQTLITFLARW